MSHEQDYNRQQQQNYQQKHPQSHQMVKAGTTAIVGGSLLVLSGLILAGNVIFLALSTPLLVIFSPVLVPAALTTFLLGSGFLASGGFGVAAISVLSWIYRYVTGKHPPGADQLDHAKEKLSTMVREMKDMAERYYNREKQQHYQTQQQHYYQQQEHQHYQKQQPGSHDSHQMVKAATAATGGGSLLVLSGLTLAGTVVALTLAAPLAVIFSPVLVPAVFTIFSLGSGFLASGGFGVAAISILSWIYRYFTGKHPPGADQLDHAKTKLSTKAGDMKDMAEQYYNRQQQQHYQSQQLQHYETQQQPRSHQMVKAAAVSTAGGSLLVLSGLTLAGTVVALTLATPLLVIFSPVLVPAVFTISSLGSGFLASGGFGVAAISVLLWTYRYVMGKRPPGADQLDNTKTKLGGKAWEMKDKAEQFEQHNIIGSQAS